MSTLAKAFVVINLLLGVMFLSVSYVLFSQQDSWKAKCEFAQNETKRVVAENTAKHNSANEMLVKKNEEIVRMTHRATQAEAKAGNLATELKGVNDELRNEQKRSSDLSLNLTKLTSSLETVQNDLATTKSLYESEKTKFEKADDERMAAKAEIVKLSEHISDQKAAIASLKQTIDQKEGDIEQQASVVAWYRAKFPDAEPQPDRLVPPPIDAKVEGVDLENGFVILSVGAEDRVKPGYTFVVYRDSTSGPSYIGEVQVDRVYPTKCSARIDNKMTRASIQVGDEAKTDLGT